MTAFHIKYTFFHLGLIVLRLHLARFASVASNDRRETIKRTELRNRNQLTQPF